MKNYRLKIFCDFDGTIAKNDVWETSFEKFISNKEIFKSLVDDYYSQKITARETSSKQLELIEDFSFDKLNEYLLAEEIDEHFRDFVKYCSENDHSLIIVSGGYEYYIDFILKKENIQLKIFACELVESPDKILTSNYPNSDEYCQLCETCKRNILINNTNDLDNEVSVYIGDSVSDQCVSGFADIVFAKGKLASFCWKNNITYFEYKNFSDIKNKLVKLIEKKQIKQRQEAKARRKDIFLGG